MPRALVVIAALLLAACSGRGGSTPPTIALTVPPAPPPIQTAGTIVFGTSVDVRAMRVANPAITFSTADLVGWVAVLSDSINGTSVTVTIASIDANGVQTTVTTEPVAFANPGDHQLAHRPDNVLALLGAGTYVLRYVRPGDAKVLAVGTVSITP